MKEVFKLIILAIVQGITEIFPISSSGHLLIVSDLLKTEMPQELVFYLHFWTALGLIIFYRKEILDLLKLKRKNFVISLILATIPGAILGFLFDDLAEEIFYNPTSIAIALGSVGVIMILINIFDKKKSKSKLNENKTDDSDENHDPPMWKSVVVGFAQSLAIIPGVSRSGICLVTSKLLNIEYKKALNLTFLLGIPMTLGPFILKLATNTNMMLNFLSFDFIICGFLTMGVELFCLSILRSFTNYKNLIYWGSYRIVISLIF